MKTDARNADYTKEYNRHMFLRLLRSRPMSRVEITKELGLTRSATTLISDDLIREGLVVEMAPVDTLRGRPRRPLAIRPDAGYAIGIYLSRDGFQSGLVNLRDELVTQISMRFDSNSGSDKSGLLLQTIRQLIDDAQIPPQKLLGVGVSSPGPIDEVHGRILNAPRFRLWANTNFGQRLEQELGVPVHLEKDAASLARYNIGKGLTEESSNFLLLLLEGGVGSSIVSEGRLLKNHGGFTSEIGHCSIDMHGRRCECGNIGCLEAYASLSHLLEGSEFASWQELIDHLDRSKSAQALLEKEADYLAAGVITAANVVSLDTVLLAGDIAYGVKQLAPLMEERINRHWIRRNEVRIRVGAAVADPHYKIIAASSIAFDHYLAI